jgi:hypothetical protein
MCSIVAPEAMTGRRRIVGAMGGDLEPTQAAMARSFGEAVARAGAILLTGGAPWTETLSRTEREQTKNAAMIGAIDADPGARLIGIVPSRTREWSETDRRLLLRTGLQHQQRNVMTGATADVVVAFPGSVGTLSEVCFAAATRRPLLFCGSVASLRLNFLTHTADGALHDFFVLALECYPAGIGGQATVDGLLSLLTETLAAAADAPTDARGVALQAVALAAGTGPTGFPGLPDDPALRERFEAAVRRISKPTED